MEGEAREQDPPKSEASEDSSHLVSWEYDMSVRIMKEMKERGTSFQEGRRRPYMVALAGCPGSGKTTSSWILKSLLEKQGVECMIVPHDGYHYPMAFLKTWEDAEQAIYRRGAPDTFDPVSLYRDLDRIRNHLDESLVQIPGFDHAKGDPEPNQHSFDRNRHVLVLCEGLYLLHAQDGWRDIATLFDLTIFLQLPLDICIQRVKVRNRQIPGYTLQEIDIRTEVVDRTNAETVLGSKHRADIIVQAVS